VPNHCHNFITISHEKDFNIQDIPFGKETGEAFPAGGYICDIEEISKNSIRFYAITANGPDGDWIENLQEQGYECRNVCIELGHDWWALRIEDPFSSEIGGEPSKWRTDRHGLTPKEWSELPDDDARRLVEWDQNLRETKKRFEKEEPDDFNTLSEFERDCICRIDSF
jgi:hypothetical protein